MQIHDFEKWNNSKYIDSRTSRPLFQEQMQIHEFGKWDIRLTLMPPTMNKYMDDFQHFDFWHFQKSKTYHLRFYILKNWNLMSISRNLRFVNFDKSQNSGFWVLSNLTDLEIMNCEFYRFWKSRDSDFWFL